MLGVRFTIKLVLTSVITLLTVILTELPAGALPVPNEPADYVANYSGFALSPSGASRGGTTYYDTTHDRVRTVTLLVDGDSISVFKFYDKGRMYTYDASANTCTETSLGPLPTSGTFPSLLPGFTFRFIGDGYSDGQPVQRWSGTSSNGTAELDLQLAAPNAPVGLVVFGGGYVFAFFHYTSFTSGTPDANVFNLPAICVS